jgi:chemotaxis signal transduction protein
MVVNLPGVRGRSIGALADSVSDVFAIGEDRIRAPELHSTVDARCTLSIGCMKGCKLERAHIVSDNDASINSQ